ncbi:hypothetical protein [Kribbella sp. NPDC051718]|uniref:hypothetical protein n=1 Tax=Kribbella sp. NPDC051718 TaxID=3155168 RepID=UPI0034170791
MTVPYQGYPPQAPQQQYQQPPAQGYPQTYPPQQGGYPAPQYAPQYPPQQGYAPQPPAAPPVPLAQGSLDDYYSQPSTGGGGGLKFTGPNNQPLINQSYLIRVTRPVNNGDIQQQTDNQNKPLFFKDGRAKFVMIVPVELLEPNPNHPEGLAKWYVKGAARDDLVRAMAEAGAPEGPPEMGAVIRVTLTGTRPSGPGMNPAHVFAVQYWRPEGTHGSTPAAAPAEQQAPAPAAQQQLPPANYTQPPAQQQYQQPAPAQQYQQAPQGYGTQQPAYQGQPQVNPNLGQAPGQYQQPAPQQAAPQQVPAQAGPGATSPAPGQPLQPPADMPADQRELLARITGQQVATQAG